MFLSLKNSNEIGICFSLDKLTIYDGGSMTSPMIGEYCYSAPSSKISSSNQLFFHFHSNHWGTATGFKLEYNATSKNHYTLLGWSGSEWPKDKALLLKVVSYLKKFAEFFKLISNQCVLLVALYSNLNPVVVQDSSEWKWKKSWLLEDIWLGGRESPQYGFPSIGDVFEAPS